MSTFFELLLESIPSFNTHKKQSYVQNNVEGGDIVWLIKIIIQTLNNKIVAHLLRSKVAPLIQRMRAASQYKNVEPLPESFRPRRDGPGGEDGE